MAEKQGFNPGSVVVLDSAKLTMAFFAPETKYMVYNGEHLGHEGDNLGHAIAELAAHGDRLDADVVVNGKRVIVQWIGILGSADEV